ncbi:MAG: potassium/proton antiporter [Xanthomonadales bacterium]|nr:potassium/proton antiporter [Xanthomonadales bacterium]
MPAHLDIALLICAGLVALGIVTSLLSFRFGAPLLLVFLLLGLSAGEDGLAGVPFDDAGIAYIICTVALALVLFDSGCGTSLASFRLAARPALALATLGVALTAVLLALPAHYLLGMDWLTALLLGAIVSSTDAAAVFFLLRVGGVEVRGRVRSTLEVESGSNDPMSIFLTFTLLGIATTASAPALDWSLAWHFLHQMGGGVLLGLAGGHGIAAALARLRLERELLPLLALSLAICLYALANLLGGSGFLAVYVAGLVVGNRGLPAIGMLRRFQAAFTWLAQIAMFITLGMLATPSEFLPLLGAGVLLGAALILVARPLAVWITLLPFGFNRREIGFVGWVGLRGAVSLLLGMVPILHGLEGGRDLFNLAFIIVLMSLLIQGWTLGPVARWLGQVVPARRGPVEREALDLPGLAGHDLVCYRIMRDSPVAQGANLPRWSRPSLVVRGKEVLRLRESGPLRPGDLVYLFAPEDRIALLDRIFAAERAPTADDREFFGDFAIEADVTVGELAEGYGFAPGGRDTRQTLVAAMTAEFDGVPTVGDRLALGPVDVIVRALDDNGQVAELGLHLAPPRRS